MRPRTPERAPWADATESRSRGSAATTPFERSARFWLHAYPRRWRQRHRDEVVGVLADVAVAGGAPLPRRLPLAEIRGLLWAGWSLRWREHPPFWRWLGYRALSIRLPAAFRAWVIDDIRSPWYPVIESAGRSLGMALGVAGAVLVMRPAAGYVGYDATFWGVAAAVWVATGYLARNSWRRHAWQRHVVEGRARDPMRSGPAPAGTMTSGVDPAITGEPPEERPRS